MKGLLIRNSMCLEIVSSSADDYIDRQGTLTEVEDDFSINVGDFWDPHDETTPRPATKFEILQYYAEMPKLSYGVFYESLNKTEKSNILINTSSAFTTQLTLDKEFGVHYTSSFYVDNGVTTEERWDEVYKYRPLPIVE